MNPLKSKMLASTVFPVALAMGVGVTGLAVTVNLGARPAYAQCNPCAAKNPCNPCAAKNPCNPCAAASPCNPCAAANPCNPCAAANPCNPCAAANPCNPCAAANPCNPCAAGTQAAASASQCVVPRLAKAAANPCNPCAAKNPCNPCAANACNPCAAKNPCNPCAAANPCNPCAAANPCNPCAANPCNPCAAGAEVELTNAEAADAYDCLTGQMRAAYAKSGDATATSFGSWRRYSKVAYQSSTHGGRFVQNYANATARAYGAFEKSGVMPAGSILAKDSFGVNGKGKVAVGPMFLMEKMPAGFNAASGNWKYTMIMPNGAVFGETNGKNSAGMQFCIECHAAVAEDQDHMMFLPEEYRTR